MPFTHPDLINKPSDQVDSDTRSPSRELMEDKNGEELGSPYVALEQNQDANYVSPSRLKKIRDRISQFISPGIELAGGLPEIPRAQLSINNPNDLQVRPNPIPASLCYSLLTTDRIISLRLCAIACMGLLAHDIYMFQHYPERRFGNTLANVLEGLAIANPGMLGK